jgi:hypothetical protein
VTPAVKSRIGALSAALGELKIRERVAAVRESVLSSEISFEDYKIENDVGHLSRLAFAFEVEGIALYRAGRSRIDSRNSDNIHTGPFLSALSCWLAITIQSPSQDVERSVGSAFEGDECMREAENHALIPSRIALAFHIAATGLLADTAAETRHHLRRFDLTSSGVDNWLHRVAHNTATAFTLLVRKAEGWRDVEMAIKTIDCLRQEQAEFEDHYLDHFSGEGQTRTALALVGFYHLAQMVTAVGDYLKTGGEGTMGVALRLDSGRRKAVETFQLSAYPDYTTFADMLWGGCRELVRNSLWSHIEGLPDKVQDFGKSLLESDHDNPVLELWPSQQEVLQRSFLDPYQRAIMVEMPTSAGKTLLAKFAIVQAKAFNAEGTVAYIVPTRALVNQVTFELRRDFAKLNYVVELAVPAFELDPTEARLLGEHIDVLVTTPEKLDLLMRVDHSAVKNLMLVVADEAHNLQDNTRGARLELLLGMIKRERRNARFLLLSPFLPNGKELVTWLGEDRALPPIQVNWRPSRRIVGAVSAVGRQSKRRLVLEALPAADNADVRAGTTISIGPRSAVPESLSISSLSRASVLALRKRGGVLVLCRGKGTAMKRAAELALDFGHLKSQSPLAEAVCEFLDSEAGAETPLSRCIRSGVAYHHAGLSQESRWLVERLIARGDVKTICGTTTLAQGVNFPISTVIVETLVKGDRSLSYSDFWNIAGRAGRALMDPLGVIAFPADSNNRKAEYIEFLKGEATAISSQLAALVVAADEIGEKFNLANLRAYRKHPPSTAGGSH